MYGLGCMFLQMRDIHGHLHSQVGIILYYTWVIDQVQGQNGWTLAKFFFWFFMDPDGVEVLKRSKNEQGQYPAILTKQVWSIKHLLYGKRTLFSCWTQWVIHSWINKPYNKPIK